eukprot:COSAG02_NODE_345_length_24135_cov_6.425404_11_plen_134_part_00
MMSALRTVTAGVPAEFIFLAETPAPAPTSAPSTAASDNGAGACSDPDKAALLQVRSLLPAVRFARCSSDHCCCVWAVDVLQREGEACLVSALTNFKAAVALGGASEDLQIIVQQLGVVLDGAIDLSKGGSFGF